MYLILVVALGHININGFTGLASQAPNFTYFGIHFQRSGFTPNLGRDQLALNSMRARGSLCPTLVAHSEEFTQHLDLVAHQVMKWLREEFPASPPLKPTVGAVLCLMLAGESQPESVEAGKEFLPFVSCSR